MSKLADQLRRMGFSEDVIASATTPDGKPLAGAEQRVNRATDRMNKTERRYSLGLILLQRDGAIKRWAFEALKFRLADRTWYTPDFDIWYPDGRLRLVEVKGFMRDDAIVKFKVARETFPEWEWIMVRWIKGDWEQVNV